MGLRSWIVWQGKDIGYSLLARLLWPRCSAAALVVEDGKILAIDTGDYLMLPGGGLDCGESFRDAAERETREETGVEIDTGDTIAEQENSVGGVEKIFAAETSEKGELKKYWEGLPRWVELDEARERRWRHDRDIEKLLDEL